MNCLLLVNNIGEAYITYIQKLGNLFESEGHTVYYAIDIELTEKRTGVTISGKKFYFNNQECTDPEILEKYQDFNCFRALYPCYDRNLTYGYKKCIEMEKNGTDLMLRSLSFFDRILSENKIDFVFSENVSNSFLYSAYLAGKKTGAVYIGLIPARMPGRYELWTDEFGNIPLRKELFEKTTESAVSESEKKEITEYIASINEKKPDYMANNITSMDIGYMKYYLRKFGEIGRILKLSAHWDQSLTHMSISPVKASSHIVRRNFARKSKIKKLSKRYAEADFSKKYFVYPMHFQPESSTSVNAMFYANQVETIQNLAFSLPLGTELYVKDHPNGIGFLSKQDYDRILNMPNVRYISPLTKNDLLLKNSLGVVTLTSTMGYEALLMKKPVLTVGRVFYNYHPYCYHVADCNQLFDTMRHMADGNFSAFDEYNLRFVKTYTDTTFSGHAWESSEETLRELIGNICEVVKETKNGRR